MKSIDNNNGDKEVEIKTKEQQLQERQAILSFVTAKADNKAKSQFEAKRIRDQEKFQLVGGRITSLHEEKQAQLKILAEFPQDHEPKFVEFFNVLAKLANWSDDQIERFRKPQEAPDTINETIYDRFPREVRDYVHIKNPYIKWCLRKHKNYQFFGEEGILTLEQYIFDTIVVMQQSNSYYEFRVSHSAKYGTTFQYQLFV